MWRIVEQRRETLDYAMQVEYFTSSSSFTLHIVTLTLQRVNCMHSVGRLITQKYFEEI